MFLFIFFVGFCFGKAFGGSGAQKRAEKRAENRGLSLISIKSRFPVAPELQFGPIRLYSAYLPASTAESRSRKYFLTFGRRRRKKRRRRKRRRRKEGRLMDGPIAA